MILEKDTFIDVADIVYSPPHRGDGDRNFNIDENNSFKYVVKAELNFSTKSEIGCRIYMRIREEKSDHTTVDGWSPWVTIFKSEAGWNIGAIKPIQPSEEKGEYNKRGGFGIPVTQPKEIVDRFWIKCDRYGTAPDIPGYTELSVKLKKLHVVMYSDEVFDQIKKPKN